MICYCLLKAGYSPLYVACQSGSIGTVKLLLENGAQMNLANNVRLAASGVTLLLSDHSLLNSDYSSCDNISEFIW